MNPNSARPTNSNDFYGENGGISANTQQVSNRRPHQEPPGSDIFNSTDASPTPTPRRGHQQQSKQSLDVFGSDNGTYHPPNSGRRSLATPENLDIFGREAAPALTTGKRLIQQPHSHIFDSNEKTDYNQGQKGHAMSAQQQQYRAEHVNIPAGSNHHSHLSSGIFGNESDTHPEVVHHRRPAAATNQSRDVFGNGKNEYREPTDYQTSSHHHQHPPRVEHSYPAHQAQQPQDQQQDQFRRQRGGDTTQSLASCLSGGDVAPICSRPTTASSSTTSLMGSQGPEFSYAGRKKSNAGQSSLVLN
jgi:hypothetical protein